MQSIKLYYAIMQIQVTASRWRTDILLKQTDKRASLSGALYQDKTMAIWSKLCRGISYFFDLLVLL